MKLAPKTPKITLQSLLFLASVLLLAMPLKAVAERVWSQGTTTNSFTSLSTSNITLTTVNGDSAAVLKRKVTWQYDTGSLGPSDADLLSSGNVLIADPAAGAVTEVNRSKNVVWSYSKSDNAELTDPSSVQRLKSGNTLIVDRSGDFVIEVTPDKKVVWKYGAQKSSTEPGSAKGIYSATRLSNGNTLIVDRSGTRVLEIKTSDYDASSPTLGFKEGSVVWRYGLDEFSDTQPGALVAPKSAVRLANGNTLIVDSASKKTGTQRVIEVNRTGTVQWGFSSKTSMPSGTGALDRPSSAVRLDSGHTLVTEEGSGRVLELDSKGKFLSAYSVKSLLGSNAATSKLTSLRRSGKGVLVADAANKRVVEIGYASSGTMTSGQLDLTLPGVPKLVDYIKVTADKPSGTSVNVQYSLDGKAWKGSGTSVTLPSNTMATLIKYRVKLSTTKADLTPIVKQVTFGYDLPVSVSTGSGTTSLPGTGLGTGLGFGTGVGTGLGGLGTGFGTMPGGSLGTSGSAFATVPAGMETSGTTGLTGATPFAVAPTGPRFTQGTLLQASNPGGNVMRGAVGGLITREEAPLALLFVGLSYGAGISAGWIGKGAKYLFRIGLTMFGRS